LPGFIDTLLHQAVELERSTADPALSTLVPSRKTSSRVSSIHWSLKRPGRAVRRLGSL